MFKGSEIVRTLCLRKLVVEAICDIIVNNASYMHYVRTIEFPFLKFAIDNGAYDWKMIRRVFHKSDAKMSFLFREFERYRNFLAPLKMVQENI